MKINQYFDIREFVSREAYNNLGDNAIWLVDPRVIEGSTYIRTHIHLPKTENEEENKKIVIGMPTIINDWHLGGQYNESGHRMPESNTGAKLSQHKFGRAIDVKVKGMTAYQVYDWSLANWPQLSKYFTTMEDISFTKEWVHFDCRWVINRNTPLIVRP